MKKFKIAYLYYDLMNLYGENGNIRYLEKRLKEQDIDVKIDLLSVPDKIDYEKYCTKITKENYENNLKNKKLKEFFPKHEENDSSNLTFFQLLDIFINDKENGLNAHLSSIENDARTYLEELQEELEENIPSIEISQEEAEKVEIPTVDKDKFMEEIFKKIDELYIDEESKNTLKNSLIVVLSLTIDFALLEAFLTTVSIVPSTGLTTIL